MKAMLISIKPKYVAQILNGEKTIEIRKTMPKCDLPVDVYIYCTKEKSLIYEDGYDGKGEYVNYKYYESYKGDKNDIGSGKVVAKFTLNKVEEITTREDMHKEFVFYETALDMSDLLTKSCLDYDELDNYLYGEKGYACHIDNLVIFDKPKELSEFYRVGYLTERDNLESHFADIEGCDGVINESYVEKCYKELNKEYQLTKAPQSWCYVEAEVDE